MNIAELLLMPQDAALRFLPEGPYPMNEDSFSWVAIQHGADKQFGSVSDRLLSAYLKMESLKTHSTSSKAQ